MADREPRRKMEDDDRLRGESDERSGALRPTKTPTISTTISTTTTRTKASRATRRRRRTGRSSPPAALYRCLAAYRRRTASRSTGFDVLNPSHKSPALRNRAGALRIVKSLGSIVRPTSFQVRGVETPAKSLARAL